jgi:hypothetical protein
MSNLTIDPSKPKRPDTSYCHPEGRPELVRQNRVEVRVPTAEEAAKLRRPANPGKKTASLPLVEVLKDRIKINRNSSDHGEEGVYWLLRLEEEVYIGGQVRPKGTILECHSIGTMQDLTRTTNPYGKARATFAE